MPSPTPDPFDDDPDIPVLTDRVLPGAGADPLATPSANLSPDDLASLHRQIVSEVVAAVQDRLANELEDRLRNHLIAEMHAFVTASVTDLQQDIANTVGDAVAQALARRNPPL
jgi:hypothetical protein